LLKTKLLLFGFKQTCTAEYRIGKEVIASISFKRKVNPGMEKFSPGFVTS
jgi:hypothetical protein